MLAVVLWALVALVALAVTVVLLPFKLRIEAASAPRPVLRVDLRIAAGFSPWMRVFDSSRAQPKKESDDHASKSTVEKHRKPTPRSRRKSRIEIRRVLGALPDLLSGLLRVLHVDRLGIDAVFGLDDPAETGAAYGAIAPPLLAAGHALGRPDAVRVIPVFDGPRLEGRAEAELTLRPARALVPSARFAWAIFGPRR